MLSSLLLLTALVGTHLVVVWRALRPARLAAPPTSLISWCPCGTVAAVTDSEGRVPFLVSIEHRDCGPVAPIPASADVRSHEAAS